jgi:hypothetical protein
VSDGRIRFSKHSSRSDNVDARWRVERRVSLLTLWCQWPSKVIGIGMLPSVS